MSVLANLEGVDEHGSVGHRAGQTHTTVSCRLTPPAGEVEPTSTEPERCLTSRRRRSNHSLFLTYPLCRYPPRQASVSLAETGLVSFSSHGDLFLAPTTPAPPRLQGQSAAVRKMGKIDVVLSLMPFPFETQEESMGCRGYQLRCTHRVLKNPAATASRAKNSCRIEDHFSLAAGGQGSGLVPLTSRTPTPNSSVAPEMWI